jgi:uncharacterized repeat protein (TIGR02543 family)
MKKPVFLTTVAAFLMLTSSVVPAQAEESTVACSSAGSFTIVDDVVTGSSEDCAGEVIIPAFVKKVDIFAFAERRLITSVKFEAGSQLVEISAWAFEKTNFTSIELPAGLKLMDYHAFHATKILSISIPASVETLGASFRYSSLESVVFEPRGGSSLPAGGGFDESQNLKSVTYLGANEFPVSPFQIEKAAHDWVGWSTSEGGPIVSFPLSVGESGVTFIPNFLPRTYNATFDSTGGSSVEPGLIVGGQVDWPTPPTRDGYAFMGWSDSDQPGANTFAYWYRNNDAAFYAVWAPKYPVSLDPKGGALSSDASFVAVGEIASAPASPSRVGYTFQGWSASENGNLLSYPYRPEALGAITLYAKWIPNILVANIDANGGSEVPSLIFVTDGEIESAPETPTRAGYSLAGWSTTQGGDVISFPYYPTATEDITLYAEWTLDTIYHSVNFDSTGGSFVDRIIYAEDTQIQYAPWEPEREGYTFVGWSTTENSEVISFPYKPVVNADITLYAKWAPIINYYSLYFDPTNGSAVERISFAQGSQIESAPEDPVLENYTFEGWSETEDGKVVSFPYTPTSNGDVVLFAKWSLTTFSVNFNSNGGSPVAALSFLPGWLDIDKAPAMPTRQGYRFAGWFEAGSASEVTFPYSPGVTENITLYAKWTLINVKAVATVKPTISGTAKVKSKLTAKPGVWSGAPTPKITYQWYSCTKAVTAATSTVPKTCKALSGKTASTLTLASTDKNKFIAVRVTGTSVGTSVTIWLSKSTTAVK